MSDEGNQEELKRLISHYEQKIFALALYLIGGDRNRTYDVASSAFAEAIRESGPLTPSDSFLAAAAAKVVEKSRTVKAMPCPDEIEKAGVTDQERGILQIVSQALQALSFDEKALILMRDQLNLPYKEIAVIFRTGEKDAQIQTIQARSRLRKKISEWTRG